MNLIWYRGLNCHLASVINIAALMGIDYHDAFSNLWSETNFKHEKEHHIFASQRVYENLELIGMKRSKIDAVSSETVSERLSAIPVNDFLLIGMDVYYIHWNHLFGNFHEPHYFFVRKDTTDTYSGFDPTYDKKYRQLDSGYLADHAFEICTVSRQARKGQNSDLSCEAKMILQAHPDLKQSIRMEILNGTDLIERDFKELIQRITAMINNRYLFARYLQHSAGGFEYGRQYFTSDFFSGWEAVKNGLYKACIMKDKSKAAAEASDLFVKQMEEEMRFADIMKGRY